MAEVDGWLHCVASSGAKGLVPASYMQLLPAGARGGSPAHHRAGSPGPSVRLLPRTLTLPYAYRPCACGILSGDLSCRHTLHELFM